MLGELTIALDLANAKYSIESKTSSEQQDTETNRHNNVVPTIDSLQTNQPVIIYRDLKTRVNLPKYGRDYRQINDLFSEERGKYFEDFFSSPESNTLPCLVGGNRKIYHALRDMPLYFSDSYELENLESICPEDALPQFKEIILTSLSRFANELKLQGKHMISCQLSSYLPPTDLTMDQGWHFDIGSKETMIAVLQNEFSTVIPNAGLDLSLNVVKRVFNPFRYSKDKEGIPKKNYLSLPYPRYGALFVHGRQGKVIHKMSTLAARVFPATSPLKRTIVQIFRRDEDWCSTFLNKAREAQKEKRLKKKFGSVSSKPC